MINRYFSVMTIVLLAIICAVGCSSPVIPSKNSSDRSEIDLASIPLLQANPENYNHQFVGTWKADFDLKSMTASLVGDRESTGHVNLTGMIQPQIHLNSYNPGTNVADVDITLTNPSSIDGYDVRIIIFTDGVGHTLLNPDGWTNLYDIPQGLPINPFKAYYKEYPHRIFLAQSSRSENFQIKLPGGSPSVTLAIDACIPTNCPEPYMIDGFQQDVLINALNDPAKISVNVHDWQEDVTAVSIYCPQVTGVDFVSLEADTYPRWTGEIKNANNVSVNSYPAVIVAESGGMLLCDWVTITVSSITSGWVRTWGNDFGDYAYDVAVDEFGNMFVAGMFSESVDFDPGPGITEVWSNGSNDAFLMRFNRQGEFDWVRTWGGPSEDYVQQIILDSSRRVYVTGVFGETVDFDPGPGMNQKTSNGGWDIFLSCFTETGGLVWCGTWGSDLPDWPSAIDINSTGDLYVTGTFTQTVDFDPGTRVENHTSVGWWDSFISKFDQAGNFWWAKTWGGPLDDDSLGLAVNGTSFECISGSFYETADFNPGGTYPLTSNGETDAYLLQLNSDGNFMAAKSWGGTGFDKSDRVAVDSSGHVFAYGTFSGTADLLPGNGIDNHISNGGRDIFVIEMDSSLNRQKVFCWGGSSDDSAGDLVFDQNDNLYLTGSFQGTVDFDPGAPVQSRISNGGDDIYITQINSFGLWGWTQTFGGGFTDLSFGITNVDNHIYTCGIFTGTVDFKPGPGIDERTSNIMSTDDFLLKMSTTGYW